MKILIILFKNLIPPEIWSTVLMFSFIYVTVYAHIHVIL